MMDTKIGDGQHTRPCDIIYHSLLRLLTDLRKDLDIISVEVNSCKNDVESSDASEKSEDNNKFLEQVLQSLLAQNDRLQEALNNTLKEKHCITPHEETNNQAHKCQIDQYKEKLCQKEQQICNLTLLLNDITSQVENASRTEREVKELRRKSRRQLEDALNKSATLQQELNRCIENEHRLSHENNRLKRELAEEKQKNADLVSKVCRIKDLMATQEEYRAKMGHKYTKLETSFDVSQSQLQNANKKLMALQNDHEMLEKRHIETETVRHMQCNEIFKLKQQMGALMGKHRTLEQLLATSVKEIETLRLKYHKQQNEFQEKEHAHKTEDTKSKQYIADLKNKLERVLNEYNVVEAAYKEEHRIRKISESMNETYRKWKEQQLTKDEESKAMIKNYVEHIESLMHDKKCVQEKCRTLHMENEIMRRELERLMQETQTHSSFTENNMFSQRLELIRATSLRITQELAKIPLLTGNEHQFNNFGATTSQT